jgi:lysophospholipase L1-like esterase
MKKVLLIYVGVLSALPALLGFSSCNKEDHPIQIPVVKDTIVIPPVITNTDNAYRYLALGDSYTIGQNVPMAARFPAQTVALLRQSNINITDPLYIATTGWTTTNLMNAINNAALHPPYDVVSLLIGVNDQYQTRDTTNYRARFTQLLNKSIALAGNKNSRVFVVSIPDYSVTPFVSANQKESVSMEIDQFNAINREVTEQKNVVYIDITPGSREGATNRALIANDNLHPSGMEYAKWAALLAPAMKAVLQ